VVFTRLPLAVTVELTGPGEGVREFLRQCAACFPADQPGVRRALIAVLDPEAALTFGGLAVDHELHGGLAVHQRNALGEGTIPLTTFAAGPFSRPASATVTTVEA
jgi:hypothetical protein